MALAFKYRGMIIIGLLALCGASQEGLLAHIGSSTPTGHAYGTGRGHAHGVPAPSVALVDGGHLAEQGDLGQPGQ